MKLKHLLIENFRQFKKIDIEFDDNLTVLVGNNGTGKTTILDAASIAINTLTSAMDGLTNFTIKKNDARYQYYHVGDNIDVQQQYPVKISAIGIVGGKEIAWSRSLNSANGRCSMSGAKDLLAIAKEYLSGVRGGDVNLILPIISYYGTGRLWNQHREKNKNVFEVNNRLNGYIDSIDGAANDKLMKRWFQRMAIKKYRNSQKNNEYNAVCKAMEYCFSSISGFAGTKVEFNIDTNEIDIVYRNKNGEAISMPLSQFSDGYKSTISLIADIAYRMAVINPQLEENVLTDTEGIVIIDEIELHLHPTWQRIIIKDLRKIFPKVQFILTTHSPSVLSNVKKDNIKILEDEQIYSCEENTYGRKIDAILGDVMKVDSRPEDVKELIMKINECIDNQHLPKAKILLSKLISIVGENDESAIDASIAIRLEEM